MTCVRAPLMAAGVVTLVLTACAVGDSREASDSGQPTTGLAKPGVRGCPDERWPGPWTACAEAAWVRDVARSAGFRVVEETGSALVVANADARFYVWTTGHEVGDVLRIEPYLELDTVADKKVYGDERLWRLWGAQGFVFWVKAGPTEDDRVPSPRELEPLIRASGDIAPPR